MPGQRQRAADMAAVLVACSRDGGCRCGRYDCGIASQLSRRSRPGALTHPGAALCIVYATTKNCNYPNGAALKCVPALV